MRRYSRWAGSFVTLASLALVACGGDDGADPSSAPEALVAAPPSRPSAPSTTALSARAHAGALTIDPDEAIALPVPTATEPDAAKGFSVNARIHPRGRPTTWRVEYGETSAYGASTPSRALPGKLAAHYRETYDRSTGGWRASIYGDALSYEASEGGFSRYTDDGTARGNDSNHISGVGMVHLANYLHVGAYDPGFDIPLARLGGSQPDLRDARVSLRIRGNGWKGTHPLVTWIQASNHPEAWYHAKLDTANWAYTDLDLQSHLLSGAWEDVAFTLRNNAHAWTYSGRNDDSPPESERYFYGELDRVLGNVTDDVFLAGMLLDVDWMKDAYPSGSIDYDDITVAYRQHSVCAKSNGGTLLSAPRGGTGAERLTDGWRNGDGHEWQSAPRPSAPQEFVYGFEHPITLKFLQIHNATKFPAKDIAIDVSEDGATWTEISAATLPASSPYGPNFIYHFMDNREYADAARFLPLYERPITHLRVRVLSGYSATRWGLGEIEAFGTGAVEQTENDWYEVNQDVALPSGVYHYRVVAEGVDGEIAYGPDQTVFVPQ